MNVDPITGLFLVLAIVGWTLVYIGMPVILPAAFIVWKRHRLKNPRVFGALAILLCLLARLLFYRGMAAFLGAGGRDLIGDRHPWVVEVFLMMGIIYWLDRVLGVPKWRRALVRLQRRAGRALRHLLTPTSHPTT
jgi:uncharacterized membrane protein